MIFLAGRSPTGYRPDLLMQLFNGDEGRPHDGVTTGGMRDVGDCRKRLLDLGCLGCKRPVCMIVIAQ
jgi:hypothetical protein